VTVEPVGIVLLWPEDNMVADPWQMDQFSFAAGRSVSAGVICFSDRADFPAKAIANPDGSTSRTLSNRLAGVMRWWKGKPAQWKLIKTVYRDRGSVYWRVEGKSSQFARIVSATRSIRFDLGTMNDIYVSPSHDLDGDEAIWPTVATAPSFLWTDDTRGVMYYWVDMSVDPSVPKDKELTVSFGGKIKGDGIYQLTAAQWKKLRIFSRKASGGVLYWRVRGAEGDKVLECASGIRKLVLDGGEWTLSDLDLGAQAPEVSWTHSGEGIVKYRLQFSADETFGESGRRTLTLPAQSISGSSYGFSSAEVTNLKRFAQRNGVTTLYYRVRGEDADKAFVAYSQAKAATAP